VWEATRALVYGPAGWKLTAMVRNNPASVGGGMQYETHLIGAC
jgi:hypothetical protein